MLQPLHSLQKFQDAFCGSHSRHGTETERMADARAPPLLILMRHELIIATRRSHDAQDLPTASDVPVDRQARSRHPEVRLHRPGAFHRRVHWPLDAARIRNDGLRVRRGESSLEATAAPPGGGAASGVPRRQRGLDDEELTAVVRHIARLVLEVERGHRSPISIRRFVAPHIAFDLENAERPAGSRPVAARDIGSAIFQRAGRRTGHGVVVIRELNETWSALMMTLRRGDAGGWQVVEILRAHDHRATSAGAWEGARDADS